MRPTSCCGHLRLSILPLRAFLLAGALVATVWAPGARAHDASFPVAGDSILTQTDQGAGTEVFQFEAAGPEIPLLDHDPRQDGTSIFVRGLGGNAGRSALATLDRNFWSATANGFAYGFYLRVARNGTSQFGVSRRAAS